MERRLAAILAADVAGYSRLMGEDETGTLTALQAHRSELLAPAIAKHRGRIVKLMGDGILAEFNSVVEAVGCAAEIQQEMAARNLSVPDNRKMLLRIGAPDSALEGTGIRTVSPAVNGTATGERSDGTQPIHHHVDFVGTPQIRSRERDRQFESASLQR